jgi:hypothetical protein
MTGSFTVSGGNTTVTFEYTALTAKVQDVVGDASHLLWDRGYGDHGTEESPILFADLTNQQKLNIVDLHVKNVMLDLANTFKSLDAQRIARETEAQDEYTFD